MRIMSTCIGTHDIERYAYFDILFFFVSIFILKTHFRGMWVFLIKCVDKNILYNIYCVYIDVFYIHPRELCERDKDV